MATVSVKRPIFVASRSSCFHQRMMHTCNYVHVHTKAKEFTLLYTVGSYERKKNPGLILGQSLCTYVHVLFCPDIYVSVYFSDCGESRVMINAP